MSIQDRPPGPTATTATGRPGGHHGDRRRPAGLPADRTVAAPVSAEGRVAVGVLPGVQSGAVLSATRDGDQTRATGLPADRAGHRPPVLSAPPAARSARGSVRAERAGTTRAVVVPARELLLGWAGEAFALMVIAAASYVVGLVLGLLWLIYGGR